MPAFILTLTLFMSSCLGKGGNQSLTQPADFHADASGDTVGQLGNNIMVIYQDSRKTHWFGSWETGVYAYDGNVMVQYTMRNGLPSNRVEEIKEDKLGNVFINTSAGLCKFVDDRMVPLLEALTEDSTWQLQPDDLWFKCSDRGYVCRYDGQRLHRLRIPKNKLGEEYLARNPYSKTAYTPYSIYQDRKGNVWFGTEVVGAFRYNGEAFDWITESDVTELHGGPVNGVRSIIEDREGYFWFNSAFRYKVWDRALVEGGTFHERLPSIGSLDGRSDGDLVEYLSIAKDQKQDLWIATYEDGVWKIEGQEVKHFSVLEEGANIKLFYIYVDRENNIWLGTHENGAYRYEGKTFTRFLL